MQRTKSRMGAFKAYLYCCATALIPLFATPNWSFAETLDEAIRTARVHNPNLEAARLAVRAAREDRAQAFAAYLPSLELVTSFGERQLDRSELVDPSRTRTRTRLDPATTSARLTQALYTGGRRGAQMRAARATIDGARQGLRAAEHDTILATVDAFVSVRRDAEIVRLRDRYVADLQTERDATERRLRAGDLTRTDLAQAQARLAGAHASLAQAHADLAASQARYAEVTGEQADVLAPPEALPPAPATLEEAIAAAQASHPALLQARQAERAARERIGVERAGLRPQLSIIARGEHAESFEFVDDRQDDVSAVVQVTLPLFQGGYAASRVRQSRFEAERIGALAEARRREVVREVIGAWSDLEASRAVAAAAAAQVDAAETAVHGAQREHAMGLRSTIDVLDAERDLQDALIARARADADQTFNAYALSAASGGAAIDQMYAVRENTRI